MNPRLEAIRNAGNEAFARAADIPDRYYYKTLAEYQFVTPDTGLAKKAFARYLNEVKSGKAINAIVTGNVGTGKTHLACAVLKEACLSKISGKYTTLSKIFRRIKSTYNKETAEESEAVAIAAFVEPKLLVIDEVGIQSGNGRATDHDLTKLSEIVDERWNNEKSTILISNLSIKEIPDWIGERAYSRLAESQVFLPITGPDYRQKAK